MSGPADPPPGAPAAEVPVDLSAALRQMTGLVLSRETVDTALELVVRLAARTTEGTTGAGVTVVDEHGRRSKAASDQLVERADALQYDLDEGPCLTAWATGEVVRLDDTATDGRWPRWSPRAAALGVRSVLSAPLVLGEESVGAMKVYGRTAGTYGAEDEEVMRLLADQAAILLTNSQSLQEARRLSRQLTAALAGRDAIAQAVGVLLAQGATSTPDAFARLTAASRQADRPVRDVATALVTAVVSRNSGPPAG